MHVQTTDFTGVITAEPSQSFTVHCGCCGAAIATGVGSVRPHEIEHHCPDTTSAIREWSITFTPTEVELLLPLDSVDLDV